MQYSSFISDFDNLPEHVQEQVLDYIEFLMSKYKTRDKKEKAFKFDWEDGLSGLKSRFTSVELQHTANQYR